MTLFSKNPLTPLSLFYPDGEFKWPLGLEKAETILCLGKDYTNISTLLTNVYLTENKANEKRILDF
jgi:hypothetical protein